MIILQFSVAGFLGLALFIALIGLTAVVLAYFMGAGSVNVELEVKRRIKTPNIQLIGYQPYCRESVRAQTPPHQMPPRRL